MKNLKEGCASLYLEQEKFVTRRMVVKIGSSTITGGSETLDKKFIESISQQVGALFNRGVEVLIVSSGAVASGKRDLGNVNSVIDKQVAALYGQPELISEWRKALNNNGVDKIGQLLVKDTDLKNIKPLLDKALRYGVVIVNANDPVNDYEMKQFLVSADNDKLAGFLAKSIDADTLLLLTDKDGVLDRNGKTVETFDSKTEIVIFDESKDVANGGIASKIQVAQEFAGRSIIANGRSSNIVLKVARGEKIGTRFHQINFDANQ
jgi:glutamate 5-kinase